MPPSEGGTLLSVGTDSDETLAAQLSRAGVEAKELASRAGTEAREFASRAAAFTAEKAPKIRKKAEKLTQVARNTLADSKRRKALVAANKKTLAIGIVIVALVVGAGWTFAKHQATAVAKDRIDGFLIRNGLSTAVTYDDVTASPFGTATLSGVTVRTSKGETIAKIGALKISNVETEGDMLLGVKVSAASFEVPLLALARSQLREPMAVNAIGMGYTTLKGNLSFAESFDDQRRTLSIETTEVVRDLGSVEANLVLGNLNLAALGALANIARAAQQNNPAALLEGAFAGARIFGGATLMEANVTIDNSGWFKRNREITAYDVPVDVSAPVARSDVLTISDLVRAGMSPSDAEATREAIENWLTNGGTLRLETNIGQPVPLFRPGGIFGGQSFAFSSPAAFLVATKARILN